MMLHRWAIGALVVHIGLGMVSNLAFLAAFQLRVDWFVEPAGLVAGGPTSAELLRWAATTDLLSYYLPTGVVAYVLWRILRPRSPVVADLSTLAALGFVLLGGAAAATLAVLGPALIHEYAAAGSDRATIAILFGGLTDTVFRAVWQFVDALLIGIWWLGLALLVRAEQPRFSALQFAIAAAAFLTAVLTMAGAGLTSYVLLGLFFTGWFAWAVWLLVLVWRRSAPFDTLT
jgi:hypothetical protein